MARKAWWPGMASEQLVLVQNFQTKIATYAAVLNLAAEQITAAQALCDAFIGASNLMEQSRTAMRAMTQWRNIVLYGDPTGEASPAPPIFPVGGAPAFTRGVVKQFFAFRDMIISLPGYTDAIGEDLGLIGPEITLIAEADMFPDLRAIVSNGNFVNLNGSMQGMDALRVEYAPKGGQFSTVAFLTKTPGGFTINTGDPSQAQAGLIRAIFIRKNADFGSFSPSYPVTVS